MTIDLRSKNISTSSPFAVGFIMDGPYSGTTNNYVMATKAPIGTGPTSYTYSSESTSGANWYYYSANTAGDSIVYYLVRAYVSFPMTSSTTPTITSFSPTSGPIGTTVTIAGTNFNTTAANNIVYFGAVKAMVNSATSTSLNVTVPIGATYQPITETVNGLTAYSSKPFIVTFAGGGSITSSSFATKVDFTTGSGPYHIAIADFDGDGKPDLVTTNFNNKTISVFRNTSSSGSITNSSFANKVDFATDSLPNGITAGDIDGDGKPDLIVVNSGSNKISVFRNTSTVGSISFTAKADFATGSWPCLVAIGDFGWRRQA